MNQQCQGCGAFEGGNKPTAPCQYCSAIICSGCKVRHEEQCQVVQKARRSGFGATVHQSQVGPNEMTSESPSAVPHPVNTEIPLPENYVGEEVVKTVEEIQALTESVTGATPLAQVLEEHPEAAPVIDPAGLLEGLTLASDVVVPATITAPQEEAIPAPETALGEAAVDTEALRLQNFIDGFGQAPKAEVAELLEPITTVVPVAEAIFGADTKVDEDIQF